MLPRKCARKSCKTYGKNPLKGERSTPSPLVVALVESVGGTGDNDLTNRPTHLEGGGASTSERNGHDLTGVGGSVGNEETPGNTFEGLSDDEKSKGIGLKSLVHVTLMHLHNSVLTKKETKMVAFISMSAMIVVQR